MIRAFRILLLLVGIVGCSGEDEKNDCEGTVYNSQDAPDAVQKAVSKYLDENSVACFDTELFNDDKALAEFIVIEYGKNNDCPAGCFKSNLCAIVDDGEPILYSTGWYAEKEIPNGLNNFCTVTLPSSGSERNCDKELPGRSHPITEKEAFKKLEASNSGLFRYCF